MNVARIKNLLFLVAERQTDSSDENSEKIGEWTKSFTDELQVKTDEKQTKTAAKTINWQYHIYSDEFSNEWAKSGKVKRKQRMFVYLNIFD